MFEYFEAEKERKKVMTRQEKQKLKEEKTALEEKYMYAMVDGRKEKVGNFRIEPPGLFRGRGAHPKTGCLKVSNLGRLENSTLMLFRLCKSVFIDQCQHINYMTITITWQKRVIPEQVTLNIGEKAKVPEPPAGHSWCKVVHDHTATWLATWKENVNGSIKYVFLGATSAWKGQSDMMKFEKARELKVCWILFGMRIVVFGYVDG